MASALVAVSVGALPAHAASTTAGATAVGERPGATRVPFSLWDGAKVSVDVGTGNLLVSTTDLALPGIQGKTPLGLSFNSLRLGSGSALPSGQAGPGWAMPYGPDSQVFSRSDGSVLVLSPDGREAVYTQTSTAGVYASPGEKKTLTKDASGWHLKVNASAQSTDFNLNGRMLDIADRNGQQVKFTYSSDVFSQVISTAGGSSSKAAAATFNAAGLLKTLAETADVGAASRTVTYAYNSSNQLTSITLPGTLKTKFTYTGTTVTSDLASITSPTGTSLAFTYDTSHRVTSVTTGGNHTTRLQYSSTTTTLLASPDTNQSQSVATAPHTTYTLDANDRVTKTVDALNRARNATYTPFGDVNGTSGDGTPSASAKYGANNGQSLSSSSSAAGTSANFQYMNPNNPYAPSTATDGQNNASSLDYDTSGNAISNTAGATGSTGPKSQVSYHPDGTVATSTDPENGVTTYAENTTTHQITTITPPSGSGLGTTGFTYDGYGRIATVTSGTGAVTTYGYDDLDHVTSVSYSDTTPTVYFNYTNGQLTSRNTASGGGTTTWTYDADGNIASRATTGAPTQTYTYTNSAKLQTISDSHGTTTYGYDAAQELTSMQAPSDTAPTTFGYDSAGRRADTWWQSTSSSSFAAHTHTDFDGAGRIYRTWTSTSSNDTQRVFDTTYCYVTTTPCPAPATTGTAAASSGLIQYSYNNLLATSSPSTAKSAYTYDTQNRLTQATNFSGHQYNYTYDTNGNMATIKIDGTLTTSLTTNAGNQITTTGYQFDAAGEQIKSPGDGTIAYDAGGRMTSTSNANGVKSTYGYAGTGMNELTSATDQTNTYSYTYGLNDTNKQPTVTSITKNGQTAFVNSDASGTAVALDMSGFGENEHFYVMDGFGSAVALVTQFGATSGTYSYDPYGTVTAMNGTGRAVNVNPYRHTMGVVDQNTMWVKHGARWNDTTIGRWTTVDPITTLNNPDQANQYAYSVNNPLNATDPTGACSALEYAAGGGLIFTGFLEVGGGLLTSEFGVGLLGVIAGGSDVSLGTWVLAYCESN